MISSEFTDQGDDSTLFPASEHTPGQAQSRRAYKEILASLTSYEWWQDFQELTARGWDWRKAILIAWEASPVKSRVPATQEDLATQILGLASDRVIAKWRKQQPEINDEIARMQAAPLLRHRRDIYDALVTVACDPDPKAHQDRKLALELLGDYKPSQKTEMTGLDGGPIRTEVSVKNDLSRLTVEELSALRSMVAKTLGDETADAG